MNNKFILASLIAAVAVIGIGTITWAASSNYQNWRTVAGDRAPAITEQNFDRFTEMHRLMAEGDYAGAQKIRTELGLGQGNGRGCPMMANGDQRRGKGAGCGGSGFIDKNNNGVCDYRENIK